MRYVILLRNRKDFSPTQPPQSPDIYTVAEDEEALNRVLECPWAVVYTVHEIGADISSRVLGPRFGDARAKVVSPMVPA